MPRRMMYDGRNPYGSRGGYVVSSRGRGRRDRAMMDYDDDMARGGRGGRGRGRADYGEHYMARNDDMRYRDYRGGDYGEDMRGGYDGHHPEAREYRPIEAMGVFNGYYGMGDHARTYRDYGYDDYGYDDYGDYGETLTEKELEKWNKKLMSHLDEREKQMFTREAVMNRAKQMGVSMSEYGEKELYTTVLMIYTDYKKSIGQNLDLAIKLAKDWLEDDDTEVSGAEKLAVYYDCIVEGK